MKKKEEEEKAQSKKTEKIVELITKSNKNNPKVKLGND